MEIGDVLTRLSLSHQEYLYDQINAAVSDLPKGEVSIGDIAYLFGQDIGSVLFELANREDRSQALLDTEFVYFKSFMEGFMDRLQKIRNPADLEKITISSQVQ